MHKKIFILLSLIIIFTAIQVTSNSNTEVIDNGNLSILPYQLSTCNMTKPERLNEIDFVKYALKSNEKDVILKTLEHQMIILPVNNCTDLSFENRTTDVAALESANLITQDLIKNETHASILDSNLDQFEKIYIAEHLKYMNNLKNELLHHDDADYYGKINLYNGTGLESIFKDDIPQDNHNKLFALEKNNETTKSFLSYTGKLFSIDHQNKIEEIPVKIIISVNSTIDGNSFDALLQSNQTVFVKYYFLKIFITFLYLLKLAVYIIFCKFIMNSITNLTRIFNC